MIIFLGRIPKETVKYEIIDFIRPALVAKMFQKPGQIENVKILGLLNTLTNKSEFHSLVSIEPDVAGTRVIKKLNRKFFKSKHIAVREYIHRSWHNDRRIKLHGWNEELMDKRQSSRRRSTLEEIKNFSTKFSNDNMYHRS